MFRRVYSHGSCRSSIILSSISRSYISTFPALSCASDASALVADFLTSETWSKSILVSGAIDLASIVRSFPLVLKEIDPIFKAASSLMAKFLDARCVFNLARDGVCRRIAGAFSPSSRILINWRMRMRIYSSFSMTSLSISVGMIPLSMTLSIPKRYSARFIKQT